MDAGLSLARIREQMANPRQQEQTDMFVYEDDKGSTSSFNPAGRRKYQQIMAATGYVEDPSFEKSDTKAGYFCGSCEYFLSNQNTATGYQCDKWKYPDRPWGCCNSYEKKED
jgi:hypothetical protein